jgi:signal transduction histidine kinase
MYLLVSLALVVLLSTVLARPLKRLRRDSRKIASGEYARKLSVESSFHEIRELSDDLETMRSTLVGVNARLQEEIVEREAAVAKQQSLEESLRHSQRLESIGTLAGGVAHEFNNVLLPIVMYAELSLEDLPTESSIRPKLERVLKLANRAKGLSQQILTFGRQPGGTDRVALDIAPVVEEAMSMVRALIPATIDIQVDIEKDIGNVLCDAAEIQQLVVNLCSNAYKSQRSGGGLISVSVAGCNVDRKFTEKHPKLREGKHVVLKVTDTGEGMDSATIDRIFEPFFTTREVGKGTGLGLSVVHGIVVKHDGEIVVTSEPDHGTTFDVYFPLTEMQALPDIEEKKK